MTPSQKIGRLTLIELVPDTKPKKWKVKCECGKTKSVDEQALRSRRTMSCGCLRRDLKVSLMSGAFQKRSAA